MYEGRRNAKYLSTISHVKRSLLGYAKAKLEGHLSHVMRGQMHLQQGGKEDDEEKIKRNGFIYIKQSPIETIQLARLLWVA